MSTEKKEKNVREIALSLLTEVIDKGEFSHIAFNRVLTQGTFSREERVFLSRLFHGVLEQSIFLDGIIAAYSKVKINKIKPLIRNLLRMSLYQMLYMDSVPDHAAINESVKIAKKKGLSGLVPFINGLLRAFQRGGVPKDLPPHVRCSAPQWLYEKMVRELGYEAAERMFAAVGAPKDSLYARLTLSRASKEEIVRMLQEDGCRVQDVADMPIENQATKEALMLSFADAVTVKQVGDLQSLRAFCEGLCFVQDKSSICVGETAAAFADAASVLHVVDVCAAPGGKSLHLAEKFPKAQIIARDLSEEKVKLIEENIMRSKACRVSAQAHDALVPDEQLCGKMDIVLADLPCSGLGVIGRKPDIKLRITQEDCAALAALQKDILQVVGQYVKAGGLLIYSTCTVNRAENQDNAAWIRANFPMTLLFEKQFLPGQDEGDGFYIAVFRREER